MIPQWLNDEVADYDLDLIEPPRVILDIGANIGAYSKRAAAAWPEAIIHAYEPISENAVDFIGNCGNGTIKMEVVAVRSFSGVDVIRLGDNEVTHSFHNLGRQTGTSRAVECISADTLPEADLIKIDTEGCELEIITALKLERTQALVCEYHRAEDVEPISKHMRANGLGLVLHKRQSANLGILKFARRGIVQSEIKLFIGLPIYGMMDAHFVRSLAALYTDPPCHDWSVNQNLGDSLVSRSRNTITANFLTTDATHLLFLDSDLIFSPEHIRRLISHHKDMVAGFYPKKGEGKLEWVCNALDGDEAPIHEDGLQEIKYAGTGCLLIARNVFEKMIRQFGKDLIYRSDHNGRDEYDFWSVGPYQFPDGTRRYLSEDWFFCQRWRDLGGQVWGDTRVVCKHVGQAIFPLKTQEAEWLNAT